MSPAKRALQTVAPLDREFAVEDAIRPDVPAGRHPARRRVARRTTATSSWSGHQPTLGEVASLIFLGEEGEVALRKGAIWWFETRATGTIR